MDQIANRFGTRRATRAMPFDPTIKQLPVRSTQLAFASCTFWVTLAAFSVVVPTVSAAGSPEDHVSVGQATTQNASPTMPTLVQTSGATILNWNSFSFVTNEAVRLIQPSVYSIALNRVIGVDQSVVLGQLPSDSQFILINPHRNLFGQPIQIKTGEFLATTLQLHSEAAQAGRVRSEQNLPKGLKAVVNGSTIHVSEHGYVALVAPGVSSEGVIIANVAPARSASEQNVTLDLMSDGLIRYTITQRTLSQVTGLNGKALAIAASDRGTREAGGGQVLLSARSAGDILSAVVNTGGISRANRLVNRGGVVRLECDDLSLVRVAETMDASGTATDRRSGQATVLAESASPSASARMDLSERSSGSTALLRRNDSGQKPTPTVTGTPLATGSQLRVTAPSNGESGKVNLAKPSPKIRPNKPQATTPSHAVPGHSKTKSPSTSAPVAGESVPKATVSPNGDIGKLNPQKSSRKVRKDRPQSMTSSVWRQPKWNYLADWDETTTPSSGNGQVTTPAISQSTH
jgi:filamentous hemagglutinin family protein